MSVNIGVAIQTHPLRYLMASALARELPGAVQVYDPKPHEHRSAWRCYRWALERAIVPGSTLTHQLIVQDDARLCPGFVEALPRVVAAQPDSLIVLFVAAVPIQSAHAVEQAAWAGMPFAKLNLGDWVPVVAVIWPTRVIEAALAWVDAQRWKADFTADDEIVGRIAKALQLDVLATAPSLVEHPDEVDSIAGPRPPRAGRDLNRVARCMPPDDCDVTAIDWTAGIWTRF